MKKNDPVNQPAHYKLNRFGVECIEAIRAASTDEQFVGYCRGNVFKYLWRMDYKGNAKQDAQKAAWYLQKIIETLSQSK